MMCDQGHNPQVICAAGIATAAVLQVCPPTHLVTVQAKERGRNMKRSRTASVSLDASATDTYDTTYRQVICAEDAWGCSELGNGPAALQVRSNMLSLHSGLFVLGMRRHATATCPSRLVGQAVGEHD